jgi:heptosyltransferase II
VNRLDQPLAPTLVSTPQRILVRGVNWLGDAVMSMAAVQRLREARPGDHLSLLTAARWADLWRSQPAVDEVVPFEKGEPLFRVARRLRQGHYDAALIFPNSARSALEAWLARIPRRIGCARPGRNLLLTHPVAPRPAEVRMRKRSVAEIQRLIASPPTIPSPIPASAHHLYHYLHLAAALGANPEPLPPRLVVPESEVVALRQRFRASPTEEPGPPLFGLNPGAEYGPAKRWPRERFVAAAVELQRRLHCQWWILGGPADRPLADWIAAEIVRAGAAPPDAVCSLAGQTSLRELCAALRACRLLLTNDTGPMHLAAAVGTPVVALFGSTSSELTGPGLPGDPRHKLLQSAVPCAPCFLRQCPVDFRCMNGFSVESVVQAVLKVWHHHA